MSRLIRTLLVGAALSLSGVGSAHATVVVRAQLDELAKSSSVIVHGVVRAVDDDLSIDRDGPFRTAISIEVRRVLKGLPADTKTLDLVLPGGRAGKRTMRIPGMPRFREGDEVVLLLDATPRGGYALTGLSQGVFRVDRAKGEARVYRTAEPMHLVERDGSTAPQSYAPAPEGLDELLRYLQGVVAGQGGAR